MLESYVTPLLMSYVNRYIKNLKPSDLQLSLWGGDVVLSKLELKLDVLEQELKLPFNFLSGHIHELRIHVPWTKLGSEPVVITINTMECILKLKDGEQDDHESCASSSTNRSTTESVKLMAKPRRVQQAHPVDPDLPPGYVQSLIRRVINNVNIVVNNLILKYVEDDIVLSVNITSAECYTVDEFWDRAFMDISAPDLVLRKVINFSDCTVCLDKRNASGKIEFYQDPLLYKCSFRTRMHFSYDNINSKIPSVIKVQTLVESLKLSITDQQLPMFIRIMQLAIALYYGEIGGHKEGEAQDMGTHTKETVINISGDESEATSPAQPGVQFQNPEIYLQQGEDDQQGWMSWAWSFVPAIVGTGEENEDKEFYDETDIGLQQRFQRSLIQKDPIVSVGFYCTKASITFKLTEMQTESSYYSPQKVKSKEVLCMEQEGMAVEVLMMGEKFFDCQFGFVGCQALCLKGIIGVKDFEENMNRCETDAVFFKCGENLNIKGMTYLTNSLFDYRSPENNAIRAEFILDGTHHKETYTEIAGMQRFGAFYMDYLYTMENSSGKGLGVQPEYSLINKDDDQSVIQETSVKRLVVGLMDLRLDSSAVHRILKMVACGLEHEYEPYSRAKSDTVDENRILPSVEDVAALEEFIPSRLTSVTILKMSITIPVAEFNLLDCLLPVIMGEKKSSPPVNASPFQPLRPLPALQIQVDKVNVEHSVPMYGDDLVSTVSSLSQPSDNLLHHCYAHCYLKVFGFQAGITSLDSVGSFLPLAVVVPSFSTALYGKLLRLPMYWAKRPFVPITEYIFELPYFTIQATRAQTLLLQAICQSWTHNVGSGTPPGINEALLSEVYKAPGVKSQNLLPTLEGSIQNVELKYCSKSLVKCASGTVGSIKVCAKAPGTSESVKEKLIPIIQGPSDTKDLYMSKWLNESRKPESLLAPDLIAFTVQVPQQMEDCHNSGAVLLASIQGFSINVDPVFYMWLLHQPQRNSSRHTTQPSATAPLAVPISKKKEDEASVGSTPLAKQLSNQASEYASSPVKTKTATESRPLSVPMKVIQNTPEIYVSPEEKMKELIGVLWNAVKRLTLQLEVQSCCIFLPSDTLPSPSTIVSGDIPGTVRSWYHNQSRMPATLVLCLPQIKVMSAGHKHMEPLQEIPFVASRPVLEEGDAFPWTISLSQFSVYTLLGQQKSFSLLEPVGCTSTLAVTSHKLQAPGTECRHSFVVCLHVDLESLEIKCSNPQVQLLYELLHSINTTWNKIQKRGILRQSSNYHEVTVGATPSSPVRSSFGTALPDTSTCSPSADLGSPTEGYSMQTGDDSPFSDTATLEQKTSNIGGSSGRVSLWMQWMLPKVTMKLFGPVPGLKGTEVCIISELEDLSASVDMQDVYTKVKCKAGSFNIDHYRSRPGEGWLKGHCDGVILQCKEKPVQTAAKVLEVSHQQHGFLSVTYTKAVTKNVRHKLTSKHEKSSRSLQRLSEGLLDSSPQFLHEILLTTQPFDVVLSCPLLATVVNILQVELPKRGKDKGKSAGQPMRTHTLTSHSLPLIYINTSVIRIFLPNVEEVQHETAGGSLKKEDTLVLKLGSLSMAPQADNPLTRTALRKDIYQRALNLGILRDPGSEVEDRQYQIDLQSINIGTAHWDQLKPEKESVKGGTLVESERNSQNPALEWNMASSIRRHQERRAILTPILTDFSVRVTAAPAIIFTKQVSSDNSQTEEIVVCGHSLEMNVTTSLDFFLSVDQVQLLQQLVRANMVGLEPSRKTAEVSMQEQKKSAASKSGSAEASSRHSGAQDSGFGSDSAWIRIVQIEQMSGASHHRIARPLHKSSIVKNLNFIPFDIFVTASRISLMTYSSKLVSKLGSGTQEQTECERVGKSALNEPESDRDTASSQMDSIALLTAEELLGGNVVTPLELVPTPSRSSARQALGVTIVRQPGRRGPSDIQLEPLLHLTVSQPSFLLSCHHRKQKLELSVFDMVLKGVAPDYKCTDMGKTLPEALDYSVFWLQTAAGEADTKTGIPPPLLLLQIRDFLNGPAELNVEILRPLKANPTLVKLDQMNDFLTKIIPDCSCDVNKQDLTKEVQAPKVQSSVQDQASVVKDTVAQEKAWKTVAFFQKIFVRTTQIVIVLEMEPHPCRPSLVLSVSGWTASVNMKTGPKGTDNLLAASFLLELNNLLVKIGFNDRTRVLLGPTCCTLDTEANWCRHSGNPDLQQCLPKLLIDLKGGLMQIFWGQEHLNCITLLLDLLEEYYKKNGLSLKTPACQPTQHLVVPTSNQSQKTEHTSDDLRTGLFQYIQDTGSQKLPGIHEVVFYNETDDSPGMMLWRYPEPRVLTFVRITPVPFNTTEDPDISTADLGDVLQVPCTLEYWDELQRSFVSYREFSLSESKACELQLPCMTQSSEQKELVASDLWRIVLNNNPDATDEQSSDSECGSQIPCDQLVSPTALAACTRVDSCFAPWFVPSIGVSLQLACLEFHFCHHLDQLGKVPPRCLKPFISDKKLPAEQEYLVVSLKEPRVYIRQWSTISICRELQFSTELECKLLEFRNLTLRSLVKPFIVQGQVATSGFPKEQLFDGSVFVEPLLVDVGQYSIHTLDTALWAWQQNQHPEAEELVFSHFVICNDTHETLRFGQVDTDENVLLASLHCHQYSWRSHKSPQLLHICIEGWGNWRWSEPFSVDNVGTFIRTIQYKGRTASLIIKVQQLNGVQKQIIICGRQIMCSYLSQDIELRVVQHYIAADGQTVVKEHIDCLSAGQKLASYVLENLELTELCVRAKGDEEWSRDVHLESTLTDSSCIIQVPCSSGSLLYVWCTILILEPESQIQQRMVVFCPLFIMRSHLPDPVIIHIEKRSLGLKDSQIIPGQGQEEPLLNVESDLMHHLTFQAREEDEASRCAVPVSTALIKQIVSKTQAAGSCAQILSDFFAAGHSSLFPWPYVKKDIDRSASEQLAQWDSPMQVKLSAWKPCLNTILIELLPWALLVNQSKWDLWLFEGEKIVLLIPAGKVIVPPNFKEPFQIGIYWADSNTVHKSSALKLEHDLMSPKWKDGTSTEVVSLDEEGFVHVDIKLGAFPGHQKLCQFCISSVVRHGIQILQIEDRTIVLNNTPYQIFYQAVMSTDVDISSLTADERVSTPDISVFPLSPDGSQVPSQPSSVPCWDLLSDTSQCDVEAPLLRKHMLLSFSAASRAAGTGGLSDCWSLPAPIRQDFPRQSVAVPIQPCMESEFCTRAIILTKQEHLGVDYILLKEDPSPRMIITNRCSVPFLLKENLRDSPKFNIHCRTLLSNSSVHYELYHHASSFPDCKSKDTLPSILLKTPCADKEDWSNAIDINCPGTQVVFLTGYGCLYVDVLHHCSTVTLILSPKGRAEAAITTFPRAMKPVVAFRVLFSEVGLVVRDDITNHKVSTELLRLTLAKILLNMTPAPESSKFSPPEFSVVASEVLSELYTLEVCIGSLQLDNQLYNRASFHFPVLLCQEQKADITQWTRDSNPALSLRGLQEYRESCFMQVCLMLSHTCSFAYGVDEVTFELKPARLYVEDTFVYYIKTLFHTYIPDRLLHGNPGKVSGSSAWLQCPEQVEQSLRALVHPVKLQKLTLQPVNLLVSIHASLKLYIASDHTPLSFSVFERGPIFTTARQLIHALVMHYAAGALFRAGWVVGSLEILGSPASLVRSIGNGIADFFRLPYEGLTRGPGAFVSGVSRGTTSFVKHISKGTLTSITNLATSLARNMDRLSLDEEHYNRQEEWRRHLPESLGDGLRQGLSRLGISLLGAIAGIVDQPMQNFQRTSETQGSAGSKAKGVISGVGKGIVGVFTKPIGGAAELVSQTGYGILHGAGLCQLPKQLYLPIEGQATQASNSHLKYVWKMLQSLGRPEVSMALDVMIVSGSGQEHEGCLLLTSEVLFVVSLSEDTQQQAFPVTEVDCFQDPDQDTQLRVVLKQQRVACDVEVEGAREKLSEQQYNRLVDYVTRTSQHMVHGSSCSLPSEQSPLAPVEPPPNTIKTYKYLVEPHCATVFVNKFAMVKNKALRKGFN
ncbi:intermembrane lipid transfer protein VPS13B-like isoform X3 [Erpetoichthys calabaricus]|uniref:intermembrane lipid transfer protein VPS13B-like isoform X3 n=1 Tax=Erpetoichthys calabaricus TaxID=27687 RepID=UPI002233E440|nr:intermembrane lipid transfer protein VPS13B-like isoform X3 [Erpetoichthys calabaricus]